MNEKQLYELMQNLDNDLMTKGIEQLTKDMDVDIDSISKKAHEKLKKENLKMKKRKRYPIVAAALIAVLGTSVVYASDISEFARSFFNKTKVYSTVVEEDAFYLKEPVKLDESIVLETLLFTKKGLSLDLTAELAGDGVSDFGVSVNANGIVYAPGGYSENGSGRYSLHFYNETANSYADFFPSSYITLNINERSYDIELLGGEPVVASGEILRAEQTNNADETKPIEIDWIDVGFKELENGVQILTSFDVEELELSSISSPVDKVVTSMFDRENGLGGTTSNLTETLIGYDKDGNAYEYDWDRNQTGRPVTVFESDAPNDREIELLIPSLIVGYDWRKEFPSFPIEIPALGQEITMNTDIDFNIQKMVLKNIKRTSPTTAELTFDLNTGDRERTFIRNAIVDADNIKRFDCVWEGDICTIVITFDDGLTSTDMRLFGPDFVVEGNWILTLNSQQ